jgi:uncharacterized membrane protein
MILIYLDPGSGSILLQLLIAAIAGLTIVFGSQWKKIRRLLGRKKKKVETDDDEDNEQHPGY